MTFGLENPLATRSWTAVKTGTSKDMRDNWCVGWSARYTVGVWVGNFDGSPMHDVSGISGAAPAWAAIMDHLHAGLPSRQPAPPEGLRRLRLAAAPGEPPRQEWFMRGTEPLGTRWQAAPQPPAIRIPAEGGLYALDPDIPPAHQRLRFQASHGPEGSLWILDGAPHPGDWPLAAGRHRLELVDAAGRELDSVEFEVR